MPINKVIDFGKFINLNYWFASFPSPLSKNFMIAWLAGSLVLAAIGVVLKFYAVFRRSLTRPLARWWRRLGSLAIAAGFFSLLLFFFRYERSPILGTRVLMLIWLAIVILDFGRLLWRLKTQVPVAVAEEERQQRLRKYLP